jgi:predicted regulator of Ras-like GTPase activity (Roadblock/LC7/MglB family)
MAKKGEALKRVLKNLVEGNPDIKEALLVSPDGLVIASIVSPDTEADIVAAMSAAFLGLAKRAIKTLKCGEFKEVSTDGSEASLRVYSCGEKAVLSVLVRKEANLGLINLEVREAVEKIVQILS